MEARTEIAESVRIARLAARPPLTNEQLKALVGAQLRRFRIDAGMVMSEVARRVGVTRSFVSQVESGKAMPTIENLRLFADVLNVRLDDIFDFAGADEAARS